MGVIVAFDYHAFVARYSEFSYLSEATVQAYFTEATMYLRNDGGGPVTDGTQQALLLNMLTAHIAALNAPTADGAPASNLVGRISSASQGSVSLGTELTSSGAQAAWFEQTKYGLAFWNASRPYRTMRYFPGPRHVFNPWRTRF